MSDRTAAITLSVIVPSWQTRQLVLDCLAAVEVALRPAADAAGLSSEVFVVDNGSRDGTAEAVRARHPAVRLIELPDNIGFARACNLALARSQGRFVLLLNSDVLLTREALARCLKVLESTPDAGIVGAQFLHPDGRLQNSIHAFPSLWTELMPKVLLELGNPRRYPSKRRRHRQPVDVEAVLGAALLVRREAIEAVGALCEDYFFFLEETDWCWRMRQAGWRVLHVPDARLVHRSGASSKRVHPGPTRIEYHRSLYRFLRRRRGRLILFTVVCLRVVRMLVSLLLVAPLLPFARDQRTRWWGRLHVLAWHLSGCRREAGLATVPVLDARARTGDS